MSAATAGRRPVDDQHRHRRHRRHRRTGRGARPRRLRACPHHRRPRRGRRRRAAYPRRPAKARGVDVPLIGDFHYIGHKLLTDHPAAARSARQIPHQSRQCRLRREARPPVRHPHRARHQIRQAGQHRRQLGLARPGAADAPDGRERRLRRPRSAAAVTREAIVQSALLSAARGREDRPAARRRSSSRPRSPTSRISSPSMPNSPAAPTTRCISGSPKPAWAPRASSPRRRRSAFSCSRASATPSASR